MLSIWYFIIENKTITDGGEFISSLIWETINNWAVKICSILIKVGKAYVKCCALWDKDNCCRISSSIFRKIASAYIQLCFGCCLNYSS